MEQSLLGHCGRLNPILKEVLGYEYDILLGALPVSIMKSKKHIEAEIWTVVRTQKGNVALIKPLGSNYAVPIFIRPLEAQSILVGLGNLLMPRPLTHDLFVELLERLSITMMRAEITHFQDGIFYSNLRLKQGMNRITIDARPSDVLGIVARVHCRLFITKSIISEAGVAINLITEENMLVPMEKVATQDSELNRLEAALERAVNEEDYEEAARLRDKIQDLQ